MTPTTNDDMMTRLEAMEGNQAKFRDKVIAIIRHQDARIKELEANLPKEKPRTVRASPEDIAITLSLLHQHGLSIRAATDTGPLTYSKTWGVSTWSDDYVQEWLDEHDMHDLYENHKV